MVRGRFEARKNLKGLLSTGSTPFRLGHPEHQQRHPHPPRDTVLVGEHLVLAQPILRKSQRTTVRRDKTARRLQAEARYLLLEQRPEGHLATRPGRDCNSNGASPVLSWDAANRTPAVA